MKKKLMSEAALQSMFTEGDTEPTAEELAEKATEEGNETELTEEELAVKAKVDAEKDNEAKEAKEDEKLAELVQAEFDDYKLTTDQEIVELKEELKTFTAKYTEEITEFKSIIIGQIAKMRTALSIAAVDMVDWEVQAIVTEYNSTKDAFMKALPVGSVVPEKTDDNVETPVSSSLDASNLKSLGFK